MKKLCDLFRYFSAFHGGDGNSSDTEKDETADSAIGKSFDSNAGSTEMLNTTKTVRCFEVVKEEYDTPVITRTVTMI